MTREFAIKVLTELRGYGDKFANIGFDRKEALDMAIQALEQGDILDKIRAEFISLYPKNYAGAPELSGCNCVFSLNKILQIIDKYKAESEE